MKIRPLQDRVVVQRAPERLRHKDHAQSDPDDYGRIKIRIESLEKKATTERERVMRPDFGAGLSRNDNESGNIRFGDGRTGARPTSSANGREIADARRKLAELQRELAAIEREIKTLSR
jgi:hypothetical protein